MSDLLGRAWLVSLVALALGCGEPSSGAPATPMPNGPPNAMGFSGSMAVTTAGVAPVSTGGMTGTNANAGTNGPLPAGAGAGSAAGTTAPPSVTGGTGAAGTGGPVAGSGSAGTAPVAGTNAQGGNDHVLVPTAAWDCGMPGGIPVPEQGTLAFEVQAPITATHAIGRTQFGMRDVHQLGQGTVSGPRLEGQVYAGGLDFDLELDDGSVQVEQVIMLSLAGGQWAYLRNCGVALDSTSAVRVVVDAETDTNGANAWLNNARLVGTRSVDPVAGTLTMTFYEVAADAAAADPTPIPLPASADSGQRWQCPAGGGALGTEVFRETVTVGPILAVGNTKRGARTVIPITGGTATGQLAGTVIGAGGDFQLDLTSPTAALDARYLVRDGQGEVVLVRNCGSFGALTPLFEARVDGAYAWLNSGIWRSADPIIGIGFVTIVIHEG